MTTSGSQPQRGDSNSGEGSETTPADDKSGPPALSDDEKFSLLSNQRRRETLRYLSRHDGRTTLDEVAEHIAAGEYDTTTENLTSDQRKRVYVALYQIHMPSLNDAGVIDYDKDRGTIRMTPKLEQLLQYIDPSNGDVEETSDKREGVVKRTDHGTEDWDVDPRVVGLMSAAAVVAGTGMLAGTGLMQPGFGWTAVGVLLLVVIAVVRTVRRPRQALIEER